MVQMCYISLDPCIVSLLPAGGMPSMGQLLIDNEKSARKLDKVRQRRDHYARLYFKTLSELEETKWKLSQAVNTIQDMQNRGME